MAAVKTYCSLCMKGSNDGKSLLEEGISPLSRIQTAKTGIFPRKVFAPRPQFSGSSSFNLEDRMTEWWYYDRMAGLLPAVNAD